MRKEGERRRKGKTKTELNSLTQCRTLCERWGRDFGAFREKRRYEVGKMQRVRSKRKRFFGNGIDLEADI